MINVPMGIITILLTIVVVILSIVVIVFLVAAIMLMVMVRRTLKKIASAVDSVEHKAMSALIPLLGLKTMFSDVEGFVSSLRAWGSIFTHKKKSATSAKVIHSKD